jgi:hypothetical protein
MAWRAKFALEKSSPQTRSANIQRVAEASGTTAQTGEYPRSFVTMEHVVVLHIWVLVSKAVSRNW